jgi:D,D-heptose 1,7-bisphosphate phosphatase
VIAKQAIFLVGGKGTRLGSLTANTPKPLLELAPGMRFLDVLIEDAARHQFTDILLLAGHFGEQVAALYDGRTVRGAHVRVVREPEPAGTGGALRHAAHLLEETFVLANGDSVFDINWRALAQTACPEAIANLALRHVQDTSRYGSVALDGDRVVRFDEKRAGAGPGLISGGVYLLNRRILDWIQGTCSIETDVFPKLATAGLMRGRRFEGYFLDIGLPDTFATACADIPRRRQRPAAFLDRDGVINVDHGYTYKPEDLTWIEDAPAAIRLLNDAGHLVIVVTNQAGIARGYYDASHIDTFHNYIQAELAVAGAHIDAFYFCPFHPDATVSRYNVANHPDRKPNPGMILRAMADWPIQRAGSFLIGDRDSDTEAARRAGIPGHLFKSGSLLDCVNRALSDPKNP